MKSVDYINSHPFQVDGNNTDCCDSFSDLKRLINDRFLEGFKLTHGGKLPSEVYGDQIRAAMEEVIQEATYQMVVDGECAIPVYPQVLTEKQIREAQKRLNEIGPMEYIDPYKDPERYVETYFRGLTESQKKVMVLHIKMEAISFERK